MRIAAQAELAAALADAAILAGIRMAFADRVAWRIPQGRTLRLSWSSAAFDLSLDPVQEGPVQ